MGLDQYAYVSAKANARDEYYSDENYDKDDADPTKIGEPREIAYWRKHPNLQGWMERLWHRKQPDAAEQTSFNGIELELTWDDIEDLERAVIHQQLPSTQGFFFGDNSDDYYRKQDLEFIKNARAELFMGLKVFYNSSW
jgi:hypothetical protein